MLEMKEFYNEDLANHIGPESCVVSSNGHGEALTGVRAGRVLSFENGAHISGADVLPLSGRPHHATRSGKVCMDPAESQTPGMHGNMYRGNREALSPTSPKAGRLGEVRMENPTGVQP